MITEVTLFYTNYNYNPILTEELKKKILITVEMKETLNILKYLYAQMIRDINFFNLRAAVYYNKHYKEKSNLKKKKKIFLFCRNIKIKRLSQKFNY